MYNFHSDRSSQNEIQNNTDLEDTPSPYTKWDTWYTTLTNLNFKDNVAMIYSTIFGKNPFNFSMINTLNKNSCKLHDMDKTKHDLIEILQTNSTLSKTNALAIMQSSLPKSISSKNTIQYCSEHLDTTAIDKCHRCQGSVCSDCRQQLTLGPSLITYCEKCVDDVSCTIQ